ncbi:MAG: hypothetical protein K8R45_03460 [Desulfobacterales bacterium]|nr:hypothetical protein [Desulfobacterales bacterium]
MHETDIRKLFMSVLEYPGQDTDAARQVFSTLVKSTLKYRDDMLVSENIVVTVDDVRTCLGWLVPALATGNMPDTENRVGLGLLKLWLEELGNA